MLGDWWDMPSLSSYDKGTGAAEGKRYAKDVAAGNAAMDLMMSKIKHLDLDLHFLIGNHEERIARAANSDPKMAGTIGYKDLNLTGWKVHDFLEVVELDGVAYSHYFPRGPSGTISQSKRGAPSASAQLKREGQSCTAGHAQGLDVACAPNRKRVQWGLIAGSCYPYDFNYLTPQGTTYWRGVIVKHEVHNGSYNPMFVSLDYLKGRYS